MQVTYSGSGPLQNGQTTSAYTLVFEGTCQIKSMMQQSTAVALGDALHRSV